jgi:threonine/homoserine/homoserine lactone efflux protein
MSFQTWLAFAAATAVLLAIPGPTVMLVISYALAHGRRATWATVAGVALGDFTALTCSVLGVGAALAASATLFAAVKWAGAAYLVYLGVKLWCAPVGNKAAAGNAVGREATAAGGETPSLDRAIAPAEPDARPGRILFHAFAVTALNPKGIVFFIAFLPQFLDPARAMAPQIAVVTLTFVGLAAVNASLYGLMAAAARRAIRKPAVQSAVNRLGGACLIGAGTLAAAMGRGS